MFKKQFRRIRCPKCEKLLLEIPQSDLKKMDRAKLQVMGHNDIITIENEKPIRVLGVRCKKCKITVTVVEAV